ncbi:hypothetical protein CHS0354_041215 [Potamilus streckersoni]|uniref:Uncharacterized protein n=1 Tax=Potamilus streckersoni TaxID=2493646 RepID=A0AAE0VU67_9BIVA|nr:hypothetical protein CHS0354_041215 [Potamilus streckersoni]
MAIQSRAGNMAPPEVYASLLVFLLMSHIPKINPQTPDDTKKLLTKLFTTDAYNKAVRPIDDQTKAISVSIDFSLTGIIEFDSQKERLTTSGYLTITWNDSYLQWDPSNYNRTSAIFIPQDNVWKPDIALQNGVSEFKGVGSSDLLVYAQNDGSVIWSPYAILQSTCKVDITYFPFDIQTCSLKFTSWSYTKYQVQLIEGNKGIVLDEYDESSIWIVVGSSVDTLQELVDATVVFSMKLKRKPLFILLNITVPIIMLSVLSVCVFILPAESSEKASFSVTVFLALAVFLTIVTSTLPQNSDKVSILSVYMVIMEGFNTLTVMLTLFQLRLNFRDVDADPVPSWLIKLQTVVERIRTRRWKKIQPAAYTQDGVLISGPGNTDIRDDRTVEITNLKVLPPKDTDAESSVTWKEISVAVQRSLPINAISQNLLKVWGKNDIVVS